MWLGKNGLLSLGWSFIYVDPRLKETVAFISFYEVSFVAKVLSRWHELMINDWRNCQFFSALISLLTILFKKILIANAFLADISLNLYFWTKNLISKDYKLSSLNFSSLLIFLLPKQRCKHVDCGNRGKRGAIKNADSSKNPTVPLNTTQVMCSQFAEKI